MQNEKDPGFRPAQDRAQSVTAIRVPDRRNRDRGQQGVAALDRQQVPVPGHGEIDRHHGPGHVRPRRPERAPSAAGRLGTGSTPSRIDTEQAVEYQGRPEDRPPVLATIKAHCRIGLGWAQQAKAAEALDGKNLGLVGGCEKGVCREVDPLISEDSNRCFT